MKPKDTLYIKALLYAYDRRAVGFTKHELRKDLNISDEEWPWVNWLMFNGLSGDSPLAFFMSNEFTGKQYTDHNQFYLTPAGTAAVVDYLELKEAQKSGRKATIIAITSIIISILVGIAQIYFDIRNQQSVDLNKPVLEQNIGKG